MFRGKFQNKLFTLFTSEGSQPVFGWIVQERSGSIRQVKDDDLKTSVLELRGSNVMTTNIASPTPQYNSLGLRLPCITLLVKYLDLPFSFEVQVLDDEGIRRRFRFSSYHKESSPRVTMFATTQGLNLVPGWNIVQLNLAEFTQRAYRTMYWETLRVQVHANCRLRKVYFSDKLYLDEDLPRNYRITRDDVKEKQKT